MANSAQRVLGAALVAAAVLLCSACNARLGPGYRIERQEIELSYVAADAPRLHVRATYRLRNDGDRDLSEISAQLPDTATFGRENLRAAADGREISLPPGAPPDGQGMRIPFAAPWPQRQRRALVLEYDLVPAAPGNAAAAVNPGSFHVCEEAAFPRLHRPEGPLGRGGEPPAEIQLVVRAPREFRVYAGGREERPRQRGGQIEHRFRLKQRNLHLFAVGGTYQEQRNAAGDAAVIFWTFRPLPVERAQAAAARLAATRRALQDAFGPPGSSLPPEHLMETPARITRRWEGAGDPAGVAVPAGALLNRQGFLLDVASETFLDLVEHEMAHHWFGQFVAPEPEVEASLGEGLAEYAALVAAEARGGEAERKHRAALLLRWYDESRQKAADKPLLRLRVTDPYGQRVFGYNKGALLFVTLEDEYGKEKVRRALAHVAGARRGAHFGYADVLAAREQEIGQDLGECFGSWLNQAGIPQAVRARYEEKIEATK